MKPAVNEKKMNHLPFWKTKSLTEMTSKEWESLCDGCGLCCLEKFEEEKTGLIYYTNVICYFYDLDRCCCNIYDVRHKLAPNCLHLSPHKPEQFYWLPDTCAYRRLYLKKALEWWHPLISGRKESVAEAGYYVKGKVIPEQHVHPDELEKYIIDWHIWTRS